MKPSTNSHPLSLDDDDDVELEELFGFRAKIERALLLVVLVTMQLPLLKLAIIYLVAKEE